jgi:hypothetical protein
MLCNRTSEQQPYRRYMRLNSLLCEGDHQHDAYAERYVSPRLISLVCLAALR